MPQGSDVKVRALTKCLVYYHTNLINCIQLSARTNIFLKGY